MQIKNILFAAFFVATSQLSCVDEQTDVKVKLQAELDAKYETMSNLCKQITEQEAIVKVLTDKYDISLTKYFDWQIKKNTKNDALEWDTAKIREDLNQRLNILLNTMHNSTENGIKIRGMSFNEEYRKDHEFDHELFLYHNFMASFKIGQLRNLIAKWKICLEEIVDLEKQLNIA